MATQVKMPQLGETVVEGTITRWLKGEGDAIQADEALLEVSTDKVDSEIPAPASGRILKIHVPEGETVQVGTLLAEIAAEGEAAAPAAPEAAPPAAEAPVPAAPEAAKPAEAEPAPPPAAPTPSAPPPPPAPAQPAAASSPAAREAASIEATPGEPRRAILSPLVRRLAEERGVDLSRVRGTGTGGRITKQDVLGYVEAAPAAASPAPAAARPAPAAASAGAAEEVVQVGHMRKAIAEHMVRSHLETARAWNCVEVDLGRVARLRDLAGPAFKEREGFSLTWMPFVCKAVCQALLRYPQVNSTWNGDGTVTRKYHVNLGIAVALENGLIVPVIKGADGMNIAGLARSVRDLAVRARSRKLVPDEVQGGTFTITNPGPFGSIVSVPIINKGQTGILAFDAVTKRVVVVTDENGNDTIAIRPMVFLSMSWDHRVIDGAEAAQYLAELKALLERADFSSDLSAYLPAG